MTSGVRRRARVRAPELSGRGWLNTGGRPLRLTELRGRFVLLDFWTFCCINCLHVLDELRPLEAEFADVLVTIGVHSPKFAHETEQAAVAAALARHEVGHPVLDDPELETWQQYAVQAWPTLVLIDPEGYVVHVAAGEGHLETLRAVLGELVAEHEQRGTLHRGEGPYHPPEPESSELRFPAKAAALPGGTLLVADAGHHSLAELDGETPLRRIGTGRRGASDGPQQTASFAEPGAIAVLPADVAERVGYHVVVADTANHLLRGVHTGTGEVRTVAGTGAQWMGGSSAGSAREVELSSPWALAWWEPAGGVVVAMAGNHTLSIFDPLRDKISRIAGTTVEGLRDGAAADAHFAQPSGLAAGGDRLWLVDAETSALRWLQPSDSDATPGFTVHTAIGAGLFDFGHRDGAAEQALLQHPLDVAVLADGTVAVADTYNGAIRRYQPETGEVSTMASGIAEPSGLVRRGDEVVLVASAAHRLERLAAAEARHTGQPQRIRRPVTNIATGDVELDVVFTPPPGYRVDERFGPATQLEVTASPPELLADGAGTGTDLRRRLRIAGHVGEGVLQVVARAASCLDDPDEPHPVCRLTRQDWGVPVRVVAGGARTLPLMLSGTQADG